MLIYTISSISADSHGNPVADISLVENPAKNFVVIMKDGKIYKNLLDPSMALGGN